MGELREEIAKEITAWREAEGPFGNSLTAADRILAIPDLDSTPLDIRILAALGALRDDMPPDDVAAVQHFVDRLRTISTNARG